jgi:hypothetical protein
VTGGTSAVDRRERGMKRDKKKNSFFFTARAVPCGILGVPDVYFRVLSHFPLIIVLA